MPRYDLSIAIFDTIRYIVPSLYVSLNPPMTLFTVVCYHHTPHLLIFKFKELSEYLPESLLKILSRRYTTPLSTSSETAGDADGVDGASPMLLAVANHLFPCELLSELWFASSTTWRVVGEAVVTTAVDACDVGASRLASDSHVPLREHIVYHPPPEVNCLWTDITTFLHHNTLTTLIALFIVYKLQNVLSSFASEYVNIL